MGKRKQYHVSCYRDGTDDVIAICTPQGREMLSVGFWWDVGEDANQRAKQRLADAELIAAALNAYKPPAGRRG